METESGKHFAKNETVRMCREHMHLEEEEGKVGEDKAKIHEIQLGTHHSQVQCLSPDPTDKMPPVSQFPLLNDGAPH